MDPKQLRYTPSHEWVSLNGRTALIGITDHAQKEISDIVFIELPKPGQKFRTKESAMIIESVKAAFDIYSPVAGTVTRVNTRLADHPEAVNRSPYGEGWLFEIACDNPAEVDSLLTDEQYKGLSAH